MANAAEKAEAMCKAVWAGFSETDVLALQHAADAGDFLTVTKLLDRGLAPDSVVYRLGQANMTPLHYATLEGHYEVVKLLVDAKADLNKADDNGEVALHYATMYHRTSIVRLLLEAGADTNAADVQGSTSLHCSTMYDDTVDLLLEAKADPNMRDNFGSTPLHKSAGRGKVLSVGKLLAAGAELDAKDGHGNSALHLAASAKYPNSLETVEFLIKAKASIEGTSHYNATPLHNAVDNGAVGAAKCLLNHKANINAVNIVGDTPLHHAVERSDGDMVKTLLLWSHVIKVDAPDRRGRSPLHKAVKGGNIDATELLVEAGADVNFQDFRGRTPLHRVGMSGTRVTIFEAKELLQAGADPNRKDRCGCTPLHFAADRGNTGLCKLLVAVGADRTVVNLAGRTPAEQAGWSGPDSHPRPSTRDWLMFVSDYPAFRISVACGLPIAAVTRALQCGRLNPDKCRGPHRAEIWAISKSAGFSKEGLVLVQHAMRVRWSPKTHYLYPSPVRQAIFTAMLVAQRIDAQQKAGLLLPKEMWWHILGFAGRQDWDKIEITLTVFTGRIIPLVVRPSDSIWDVKITIQEKEHVPIDQQRLTFSGRHLLKNSWTLSDYGIGNKSMLHLDLQLRRRP